MRNCIFAVALAAALFVALGLCVPSVFGGGPAILEPPPSDAVFTPGTLAVVMLAWFALVVVVLVVEEYHPSR